MTVAFVDVGQGDCTVVVDHPRRTGILIDCPAGRASAAVEELDLLGCDQLVAAMVTHSHEDHFGGVIAVADRFGARFTGSIYANMDTLIARPETGQSRIDANRRCRALINRVNDFSDPQQARIGAVGETGDVGDIHWRLMAPRHRDVLDALRVGQPNVASGIVMLNVHGVQILIGGDAPLASWQRRADLPTGAVVRWPHHGGSLGGDALSEHGVLAGQLQPSVVAVSVGANNQHSHPSPGLFNGLRSQRPRVLCTQATGGCAGNRQNAGPCAGTIRIQISDDGGVEVSPSTNQHLRRIAEMEHAQCAQVGLLANGGS